ncbi:MAG: hypothetical protein MUF71_11815 [Candidatus Kapabacteria bacterium]|jgi:uncharacterized membrane protein|nr:hypothetical protein [Candidatus Kapabacteria bacterium]
MILPSFSRLYEPYSRLFWTMLLSAAGAVHLLFPQVFEAYYPTYLPFPHEAVLASGIAEFSIIALLWRRSTRFIAWLSVGCLMIVYMPVHIYVLTDHAALFSGNPAPPFFIPLWLVWMRLSMQILFIVWAFHVAYFLRRSSATAQQK